MAAGLTAELLLAALAVGLASVLIALRLLPGWLAVAVVLVKVGLSVVYFAWFYDGTWTFLDDTTYWEHGMIMLERGYDPLTALTRRDGLLLLFMLSLGPHILYAWWNLLAVDLLAPHYYSPVLLNIPVTLIAAAILNAMAREAGFSKGYRRGLVVFFLLHWELLAWTSFVSLKDVLVFTLSMLALYLFVRLTDRTQSLRRRSFQLVVIAAVMLVLPWLRFYMPAMLIATFAAWLVARRLSGWSRTVVFGVVGVVAFTVLPGIVPRGYVTLAPVDAVYGLVKSILTPRPWAIEREYTFLTVPTMLHWLCLPAALVGGWRLWRRSPQSSLVVLFVLTIMALNAITPTFQGPRHRVQVIFGFAWMQFDALYAFAAAISAGPARAVVRRATALGYRPRAEAAGAQLP